MQTVILWAIMILVLVGIPVLLAKKSGKSPMELFFGSRFQGTAFDRGSHAGEKGAREAKKGSQRNSSKDELLATVSDMVSYARRNHFQSLVPGTVMAGGKTANLAVILVTRSGLVGINCFGYGGDIQAYTGDQQWVQTLNGERRRFDSPVVKNREQRGILQEAAKECGLTLPCQVLGVFTAGSAILMGAGKTGCYTRKELVEKLGQEGFLQDGGVDPEKVRELLDAKVLRAEGKKK